LWGAAQTRVRPGGMVRHVRGTLADRRKAQCVPRLLETHGVERENQSDLRLPRRRGDVVCHGLTQASAAYCRADSNTGAWGWATRYWRGAAARAALWECSIRTRAMAGAISPSAISRMRAEPFRRRQLLPKSRPTQQWVRPSARSAGLSGKMQPAGLPRAAQSPRVMPGLVPGIHAEQGQQFWEMRCSGTAWMAGTSLDKPGHDGRGLQMRTGHPAFRVARRPLPCRHQPSKRHSSQHRGDAIACRRSLEDGRRQETLGTECVRS